MAWNSSARRAGLFSPFFVPSSMGCVYGILRVYLILWILIQYCALSSIAKFVLALTTGGSFR